MDSSSLKYVLGAASIIGGSVALYAAYKRYKFYRAVNEHVDLQLYTYETQRVLNQYLMFHYGGKEINCIQDGAPEFGYDFPLRCAELCSKFFDPETCSNYRALDVGCAVGRSTFELARTFREVHGIDFSYGFIRTCLFLVRTGALEYFAIDEGELTTAYDAIVPPDIDRSRCYFEQGDACQLPLDINQFGCVLAANLICRLADPMAFLLRLKNLVSSGGVCVITSPYSFSREYTPRLRWLGGFKNNRGIQVRGFDTLVKTLSEHFELIHEENMPFLIRETSRKHQWTVSHATVWRRKPTAKE